MSTETNQIQVDWEYGDNETYQRVFEWSNSTEDREKLFEGGLKSEAEALLEAFEQDYLEADSVIGEGSTQPQAKEVVDGYENLFSTTQNAGQALSALAEMPEDMTEFDYLHGDGPNKKNASTRYDMTSTD